ncbi:MAG: hypothetical protein ABIQ16_05065 [Polyangiaceae bacterium]
MRRKLLMLGLGLGAMAGFASGIFGCHFRNERRQAFEDHVADVCTRAAERSRDHGPHSFDRP